MSSRHLRRLRRLRGDNPETDLAVEPESERTHADQQQGQPSDGDDDGSNSNDSDNDSDSKGEAAPASTPVSSSSSSSSSRFRASVANGTDPSSPKPSEWQTSMPMELLIRVFKFLPPRDVACAGSTCRSWYHAAFTTTTKAAEAAPAACLRVLETCSDSSILWRFNSFGYENGDGEPIDCNPALIKFLACRARRMYIEQVDMEGCWNANDAFMGSLASTLPSLRRLNIANCGELTSASMRHIGALRHLVALSIRGQSHFADATIATALSSLRSLEFLDMGNLRIRDAVLAAVGACCHRLKHLYLKGSSNITGAGVAHLATCTHLVYLSLRNCHRVPIAAVHALVSHLPDLHVLDVRGCCVRGDGADLLPFFSNPSLHLISTPSILLQIPLTFTLESQNDGFRYIRVRPNTTPARGSVPGYGDDGDDHASGNDTTGNVAVSDSSARAPGNLRRNNPISSSAATTPTGSTTSSGTTSTATRTPAALTPTPTPAATAATTATTAAAVADDGDSFDPTEGGPLELYTYQLAFAPALKCNLPRWFKFTCMMYTTGQPCDGDGGSGEDHNGDDGKDHSGEDGDGSGGGGDGDGDRASINRADTARRPHTHRHHQQQQLPPHKRSKRTTEPS
ncbi:hypothetical protein PTSG_08386 [Salpingoeca rosetta]|uniref:Uncharacterized protein n=1 Tax=Salpingoeca rosetta (strain ATCC 50818 / BSB-021) TaxID=946362 RepID=F2UJJ4_SALR5|nr:uncharacterized protein PTSG_08386 [Salpingoeca rosetta]EGD77293.1 hypothetical protein PTSG_08386 [Salpingoeca rosetta]|eukprot:XP_004990637.1 hypothetical protein PTSG_08386 [Salpingoeca rosetta]